MDKEPQWSMVEWMDSERDKIAQATMDDVPNQPKTKIRSVRVPDERWEAAQKKAAEKGETVSDVINRALERYVKLRGK